MIVQFGKLEELPILDRHPFGHPIPQPAADYPPGQPHGQPELEEVHEDLPIGVSQGFERADHGALLLGQPAQQHVEHQGGHGQENGRHEVGEALQALDLLAEIFVGRLIVERCRSENAVSGQQLFGPAEQFLRVVAHVGCQPADHLVGRAVEVKHVFRVALLEIEDAEMLRIGRNGTGSQHVDELARDGRAHDEQLLAAVVQHEVDPLARL